MDDCPELLLKQLCCTCLSQDRKLMQLCRLTEGINNLYFLLSYDSEAYREGFNKDTANWYICWECWAVMTRISRFRSQACAAQKQLSDIVDGRTDLKLLDICLSRLAIAHKTSYDETVYSDSDLADNFIDCGPDIKAESDEDIPLSELHNTSFVDDRHSDEDTGSQERTTNVQPVYKKGKKKKKSSKCSSKSDSDKKYFTMTEMSEEEMRESRDKRKMAAVYAEALYKCESCIEWLKNKIDLGKHILEFHTEKPGHNQCEICLSYIKTAALAGHRTAHYMKYACAFCDAIAYSGSEILRHLKSGHSIKNVDIPGCKNKGERKTPQVLNPGSKPRRNAAMMDKRTPFGYQCTECDKYFDNKNQRWKHVQQKHREGYKCAVCSKRFAFKNNLARHEQMHKAPPPREECPHCHKQVRVDLLKAHARIHAHREQFACAECDKRFASRASYEHHLKYTLVHAPTLPLNECPHCHKQVRVDLLKAHARIHSHREQFACAECDKRFASRASYEHHLKYTLVHAPTLPLKHKCSTCDKGYRSRGELRDHVNYQHMGKTQHKCPICGKALATRRCVGRHVRRAHHGVREAQRDKICQQCGKAFRDKKGLREHEFIHTGERPLSCEICGCTFRQSASLYTHRKRVHKIFPQKKNVELLEPEDSDKVVEKQITV